MVASSRIKVFVRLRPTNEDGKSSKQNNNTEGIDLPPNLLSLDTISNTITVSSPHPLRGTGRSISPVLDQPTSNNGNSTLSPTTFQFDRLLPPPTTNSSLFQLSTLPLIRSALAGYNATLLTYGQTGAGKTFTTFGPPAGSGGSYKDRGLCARAVAGIFNELKKQDKGGIEVRVSCIEIYNESLFDLLGFAGGEDSQREVDDRRYNKTNRDQPNNTTVPTLALFESASSGPQVRGLRMPLIQNSEEGLNLLFESQMNRAIAEHQLNDASSRSHCIFTFHFVVRSEGGKIISSKLNIVDLAGSERLAKTEAAGQVQRESNFINKSLSFLEQVVIALASKSRDHIPYRQSKLTHVLKDSLGGNCNTLMIACIWPHLNHLDQTVSTLKFATRMQMVKNKPTVNENKGGGVGSAKLLRQIKQLKEELSFHDVISGRANVMYEQPTAQDMQHVRDSIFKFIEDEDAEMEVHSLTHTRVIMAEMRRMIIEGKEVGGATTIMRTPRREEVDGGEEGGGREPVGINPLFSGGNVNVEEKMLSPTSDAYIARKKMRGVEEGVETPRSSVSDTNDYSTGQTPPPKRAPSPAQIATPPIKPYVGSDVMEKKAEFESFKLGAGKARSEALDRAKLQVKEKKRSIKELTGEINYQKDRIDFLMAQLRGNEGGGSPTSPRAEDPTKQLKAAKKAYRVKMESLSECKSEYKFLQHQREQCVQGLVSAFDSWMKMRPVEEVGGGEGEESPKRGGDRTRAPDEDYGDDDDDDGTPQREPQARDYGDEFYSESPRAGRKEQEMYDKAQIQARERFSERNATLKKSGEWKL
ncbi:hypothetical protein TrLO_g15694 [Triparma laevis f. longispina]|uniref:Kinesin-like protein n=1 Tax=Triparma laevis f. longispina TaxID=1714387 RepID=A0A9W7FIB0_9STRA|nr:hypothetical protein TrLO_g15694 [Triparma laevis f. longispina]